VTLSAPAIVVIGLPLVDPVPCHRRTTPASRPSYPPVDDQAATVRRTSTIEEPQLRRPKHDFDESSTTMSHLVEDAWMTIEANLDEVPTARSHL
jgi:hypothetical protein